MRPQTQGLNERTNRSILTNLHSFVNTSQTDWDTYLAPCTYALNCSEIYATGYSPFLLVYGRHPLVPLDDTPGTVMGQLTRIIQKQEEAHHSAMAKTKEVQDAIKTRADAHARAGNLQVGDIVYIHTYTAFKKAENKVETSASICRSVFTDKIHNSSKCSFEKTNLRTLSC